VLALRFPTAGSPDVLQPDLRCHVPGRRLRGVG